MNNNSAEINNDNKIPSKKYIKDYLILEKIKTGRICSVRKVIKNNEYFAVKSYNKSSLINKKEFRLKFADDLNEDDDDGPDFKIIDDLNDDFFNFSFDND